MTVTGIVALSVFQKWYPPWDHLQGWKAFCRELSYYHSQRL